MKKLSSMLAMSLALALVLGMTAFAAPSQTTGNNTGSGSTGGTASDGDQQVPELPELPTEVASKTEGVTAKGVTLTPYVGEDGNEYVDLSEALSGDELEKVLAKMDEAAGRDSETVVALIDLDGTVPEDGKVLVEMPNIYAFMADYFDFVAYHYKDGAVEVLKVTIVGDGLIQIEGITGFSNYLIVAYDKGAAPAPAPFTPVGDNGNGGNGGGSTAPNTSPKTGESTSMAMLIVLISLAGASVLGVKRAFSAR